MNELLGSTLFEHLAEFANLIQVLSTQFFNLHKINTHWTWFMKHEQNDPNDQKLLIILKYKIATDLQTHSDTFLS